MKKLILLHGAHASGKTKWIKEQGLEDYVVSKEKMFLKEETPILSENGNFEISDGLSYLYDDDYLIDNLRHRMNQGQFIVVNDTNLTLELLMRYKDLKETYNYEVIVISFTYRSLEALLEENNRRSLTTKHVPNWVIRKEYQLIQNLVFPDGLADRLFKANDPQIESLKYMLDSELLKDFSHYKKIHHIGSFKDGIGELKTYLKGGKLKEDELYIFTGKFLGDYLWLEDEISNNSKEAINYLLSISHLENAIFINDGSVATDLTYCRRAKLLGEDFDYSKFKGFVNKLQTVVFYKFKDDFFFISHGGVTNFPSFIHGVSENSYFYNSMIDVDYNWESNRQYEDIICYQNDNRFGKFITHQIHSGTNYVRANPDHYETSINLSSDHHEKNVLTIAVVEEKEIGSTKENIFNNVEINIHQVVGEDKSELESLYSRETLMKNAELMSIDLPLYAERLKAPLVGYTINSGISAHIWCEDNKLAFKTSTNKEDSLAIYVSSESISEDFYNTFNKEQVNFLLNELKESEMTIGVKISYIDGQQSFIVEDGIVNGDMLPPMRMHELTAEFNNLGENSLGFKNVGFISQSWDEFLKVYRAIRSDHDFILSHEGFMVEDSNGHRVRISTNKNIVNTHGMDYLFEHFDVPRITEHYIENK